jgi:hypothetical protein
VHSRADRLPAAKPRHSMVFVVAIILISCVKANAEEDISLTGGVAIPTPRSQYGLGDYSTGMAANISIGFSPKEATNHRVDVLTALEFARFHQDGSSFRTPSTCCDSDWSATSWEMWDLTISARVRTRRDRNSTITPYVLFGAGAHYEDRSAEFRRQESADGSFTDWVVDDEPHAGATMHLGLGLRLGGQTAFLAQVRYVGILTDKADDLNYVRVEFGVSTAPR